MICTKYYCWVRLGLKLDRLLYVLGFKDGNCNALPVSRRTLTVSITGNNMDFFFLDGDPPTNSLV